MALKRGRKAFEADLQAQQSPFVVYGTPLAPLDDNIRDDGSYVPMWKQEVVDEHGRKRLHGAFTGGFSAGYFNTVGSKEGWAPSTFVSSRSNRRKDDEKSTAQRAEDFMDEEDLADAAEAQTLETAEVFSGFGSTEGDEKRKGLIMDILRSEEGTMGSKLLRKMGWRDGQGLGPRVKRKTRTDEGQGTHEDMGEEHLFAPDDTKMITFTKKDDRLGLGYNGSGSRLEKPSNKEADDAGGDDPLDTFHIDKTKSKRPVKPAVRGGIGTGVLNEDDSGDDDPYVMGPRISYNRVIGGDKKKDKVKAQPSKSAPLKSSNPLLGSKPVFISKKAGASKSNFRKCHDGRLPLSGFVLSSKEEIVVDAGEARYPHPSVPDDWVPSKQTALLKSASAEYRSTADNAKMSQLDAKARAEILGEPSLPGKSVFDFISPAVRDALAAATGKASLPAGLGEGPPKAFLDPPRGEETGDSVPHLSKEVALGALGRGLSGWMPYADDEAKRARYKAFLEFRGEMRSQPPIRPPEAKTEDWLRELKEFAHAAEVFKPMTGKMASRFTTSSAPMTTVNAGEADLPPMLSTPTAKVEDPAEIAAKMGMFGPLTRSTQQFYPTRLLCKRFNVPLPSHVQPDSENGQEVRSSDLVSKSAMEQMLQESASSGRASALLPMGKRPVETPLVDVKIEIDPSQNDALEAEKAGDAVFKAIFGDESDSDA